MTFLNAPFPQNQLRRPTPYILNGQQVFRLFQEVYTAGEIFEWDQSVNGIAIGPNSDLARCRLTFYDSLINAHNVDEAIASVYSPWSNLLAANEQDNFANLPYNGRIIVSLIDPILTTLPEDANVGVQDIVQPRLDLIGFSGTPHRLADQGRADLRHSGTVQFIPIGGGNFGGVQVTVPAFGRKAGSVTVANYKQLNATLSVTGISMMEGAELAAAAPNEGEQQKAQTIINAGVVLPTGGISPEFDTLTIRWSASANGFFDYIKVLIQNNTPLADQATNTNASDQTKYTITLTDGALT